MEAGDSCNASCWSFPNHAGTHIDLPSHFVQDGKRMENYSPDFWIFHHIAIVEITGIMPGSVISSGMLKTQRIPKLVDLLILKTGIGSMRGTPAYWQAGPVFSPELANYLRSRFSRLRVFGFDAISVSSWTERETGREAHKAFLGGDRPILLIEDMNLSAVSGSQQIANVMVAPLLVAGADASPCTIIAEVKKL